MSRGQAAALVDEEVNSARGEVRDGVGGGLRKWSVGKGRWKVGCDAVVGRRRTVYYLAAPTAIPVLGGQNDAGASAMRHSEHSKKAHNTRCWVLHLSSRVVKFQTRHERRSCQRKA